MSQDRRWKLCTFLLLTLAVLYVAYLLSLPEKDVFFSGDGGIKSLMVEQFLSSGISPALDVGDDPEMLRVWRDGLFPFDHPFAYERQGRVIITFPLYFPALSMPFRSLLGWRGLYVLPALGLLLTWCFFVVAGRSANFAWGTLLFSLAGLIFSSPLTLYGGMFWEHTLATGLLCAPLIFLSKHFCGVVTRPGIILLGAMSGSAVFLRPEALVVLFAFLIVLLPVSAKGSRVPILFFALSALVPVLAFLCANHALYENPLGVHSLQVSHLATFSAERLWRWFLNGAELLKLLAQSYPLIVLAALAVPLVRLLPESRRRCAIVSGVALVLTVVVIPANVPNIGGKQWGPRYYLILIPWAAYFIGLTVEALRQLGSRTVKALVQLTAAACLLAGFYFNTIGGTQSLAEDYEYRILPARRLLEEHPHRFVWVSHQWIAHELAALSDRTIFLWLREADDIDRATRHMRRLGASEVLFVTYEDLDLKVDFLAATKIGSSRDLGVYLLKTGEAE